MRRVLFIALALAAAPEASAAPAGAAPANALHGLRLEDLVATRDGGDHLEILFEVEKPPEG